MNIWQNIAASFIAVSLISCGGGGSSGGTTIPTPSSGAQRFANGSNIPSVSADGRYIAYGENQNIYLLDRSTGNKITISINATGTNTSNGFSFSPVISGDGTHILFASKATDLVTGISSYPIDSSNQIITQLYVRDIQSGTTSIATIDPSGKSVANDWTNFDKYTISRNGQFVAFSSKATNLVTGVTQFGGDNVYVRDLTSHTTELISISADGVSTGKNGSVSTSGVSNDSYFPAISDDGRYIAFESHAWNLVNGVTYTNDIFDIVSNVYIRDRVTGKTNLISISPDGTQASNDNCSVQLNNNGRYMSADGLWIAFSSRATNLAAPTLLSHSQTNVFLGSRSTTGVSLISVGTGNVAANGSSNTPTISVDGRYLAFSSGASNLIGGNITYWTLGIGPGGSPATNIYRWARTSGSIDLVSLSSDGKTGADFDTGDPALSDDGQIVVFDGLATDITVSPSVPLTFDSRQGSVYRWDSTTGKVLLVTQANNSSLGNADGAFGMSTDGKVIAFDRGSFGLFLMTF